MYWGLCQVPEKVFRKLSSISAVNSPHLSLGFSSLIIHPLSPNPQSQWYGPGAGRTPGVCAGSTRAGRGGREEGREGEREDKVGGDWLIPVARAGACVLCLPYFSEGAGDGCAPQAGQSGGSRRRPVRRRLVGTQLLSGTKAEGGKKRGRKKKKKERKEAQTAVTDRLGERSGAQAARRQAGLPLRFRPSERVRRGRTSWSETPLPGD